MVIYTFINKQGFIACSSRSVMKTQTDRQIDRQTDRQTDRQIILNGLMFVLTVSTLKWPVCLSKMKHAFALLD